jgi:phosphopantothenoylcysteine synthetase/decarboxylase
MVGNNPTDAVILYLIVCGAPPAAQAHEMIALAQERGWDVYVTLTPAATAFVDIAHLTETSTHPVRGTYSKLSEDEAWPKPSAIAVVPATFNTLNKWALGIGDTLATSILCEYLGDDIPIVAAPCLKAALARHPAFPKSIRLLKKWGVQILYDPRRYVSPQIVPHADVLSALSAQYASHRMQMDTRQVPGDK